MHDLERIYGHWVNPIYMRMLHGNFSHMLLAQELSEDRTETMETIRRCVADVEPTIVEVLIAQREWRARLVGAWYAGLRGWRQFIDQLGRLLLDSELCFAGQGYCVALACFSGVECAEHLCSYLDKWLPATNKFFDQHWALPALKWIDKNLHTEFAGKYLTPDGTWDRWAKSNHRDGHQFFLESRHRFDVALSAGLAAFR